MKRPTAASSFWFERRVVHIETVKSVIIEYLGCEKNGGRGRNCEPGKATNKSNVSLNSYKKSVIRAAVIRRATRALTYESTS